MHELAIAEAILDAAERHAEGRSVTVVRVRVGRLRQVVPESLAFYADLAAELRPGCEGAVFEWETVDAVLKCRSCGCEWDPAPAPAHENAELVVRFACPRCDSGNYEVISGDDVVVESIDVEEPAASVPGEEG
jgi:hydrogenase nickel incorporation protein HypA/HybF